MTVGNSSGAAGENPVRQEYDRLAPVYDRRWRPYIDATLQAVIEALHLDGHEKILDVPSGTGELAGRLLERWSKLRITGADLSPGMLEQARKKEFGDRVAWVQADVTALGFPDEHFDAVVCANSFHYFPRPLNALREMRRVLRPQGTFLLVDWCDDYLACKLCTWWLRWADPAFHQTYSLAACGAMLKQAGFQVVDASHFRTGWVWGMMRFACRRLD